MEINPFQVAQTSAAERSRTNLAVDFDNFLTLLTTQLSHQDPLDPVDSNEFVQQLVSFTGVEQAVNTNSNLEKLIALFTVGQSASAVSYLGTTIEASGDTTVLADGTAKFRYSLPEATASTSILITDDQGRLVLTADGSTGAGNHGFVWNGRDTNGVQQPDGTYTISVTGRNANGVLVAATTRIGGQVTRVDTVDGNIVLSIGNISVPLENVTSIVKTPPPPSTTG